MPRVILKVPYYSQQISKYTLLMAIFFLVHFVSPSLVSSLFALIVFLFCSIRLIVVVHVDDVLPLSMKLLYDILFVLITILAYFGLYSPPFIEEFAWYIRRIGLPVVCVGAMVWSCLLQVQARAAEDDDSRRTIFYRFSEMGHLLLLYVIVLIISF